MQDEIRDAAPDADADAVQKHAMLVSEVEAVVQPDQSKPVHEILHKVEVEHPPELDKVRRSSPTDECDSVSLRLTRMLNVSQFSSTSQPSA